MQNEHPIENLSAALYHAAHIALPDVHYQTRDWEALAKLTMSQRKAMAAQDLPTVQCVRRPAIHQITVLGMFNQLWGSTALGFGGLGGAAMTNAYTVVLRGPDGSIAVYWNGRFAYLIEAANRKGIDALMADMKAGRTLSRRAAVQDYALNISEDSVSITPA